MKIAVDRAKCQNHGLCAISAPANFELDADGELRYDEWFDDEHIADVEDAMDSCPAQAIVVNTEAADDR